MKIVGFVIAALIALVNWLAVGATLMILWGWFVVPTFRAPELGLVQAMGLIVTFAVFKQTPPAETRKLKDFMAAIYVRLAALLFIGWIVHFWMPS